MRLFELEKPAWTGSLKGANVAISVKLFARA